MRILGFDIITQVTVLQTVASNSTFTTLLVHVFSHACTEQFKLQSTEGLHLGGGVFQPVSEDSMHQSS